MYLLLILIWNFVVYLCVFLQSFMLFNMNIIAQTSRFSIRNFKPKEENHFLSLFDDERVTLHLPKRNRQQNEEIFKNTLNDYAEGKLTGRWGLFDTTDEAFIGMGMVRNYNDEVGKIEIGYVLKQAYWGKGIASELATILVDYCFKNINAQEVVAITTLGNIASQKVLQNAGLILMDNVIKDGEELAYFELNSLRYNNC